MYKNNGDFLGDLFVVYLWLSQACLHTFIESVNFLLLRSLAFRSIIASMRSVQLALALLVALGEAAPQLGDFADFVPAVPFDIPFGIASSTRKPPVKDAAPAKIPSYVRFANATTQDATNDGRVGVILSNDLIAPVTPGSKIKKTRHGPYKMKAAKMFDWGAMDKSPCNNCYITAMQAGLEYEDGSKANINTGAWLHHTVLISTRGTDPVCIFPPMPNNTDGKMPFPPPPMGRRLFASGNERTVLRTNDVRPYGIKIGNATDLFLMAVELMNASNKQLPVYFTMTYEYVEDEPALNFKAVEPVWMDITGCGVSSAPALKGQYSYTSPVWTADRDGILAGAGGHEHDGGTDVVLYQNKKQVCITKMLYGHRRPGYGVMPDDIVMDKMDREDNKPDTHISDAGTCTMFGTVKKGDKFQITANYDGDLHPQMARNGRVDPTMGIILFYLGEL
jgi:hypothetical protein